MRSGTLLAASLATLAALAACDAAEAPTASVTPGRAPAHAISHWPLGGFTPGFYFVDLAGPNDPPDAPFDAALSPVVRVCRVTGSACGPVLASFSRTSGSYGRRVTVNTADEVYEVDWPTGSTGARAGEVYRVSVHAGGRELGFADVLMVGSWWQFFTTDMDEYAPWFPGTTLPIRFRVEQGIPGSITLSAPSLQVGVADGRAITAQVRDLHGQPLARQPFWEVVNTTPAGGPLVAVVDSGLVIGSVPGTGTLYARLSGVQASIPVTVMDTRRAWTRMTTPDDQGLRALWGAGEANVYAAGNTGVLRHDGAAWAHVEAVRWRGMHDVFGFGAGDVWAVGDQGMILRHDGAGWSALRYDGAAVAPYALDTWDTPGRSVTLRAVWGAAPAAMWIVGDGGTALRYDGAAWSVVSSGTAADLTDVWGSGPGNVYATTSDGRLLRLGGTGATPVAGVQAPGALHAVWGTSAGNVYAVGAGGAVFRYDGTAWQRIRLPTRATLYDVWGTSAGNVYVAGEGGALYRYDGTRWTPEKSPGGSAQLLGLWGTPSGRVLAAGAGGLVITR